MLEAPPPFTVCRIPGVKIFPTPLYPDPRGRLTKPVHHTFVKDHFPTLNFGEIYLVTARQGGVRANHFHKETTEIFCVLSCSGKLYLQRVDVREVVEMDGGDPKSVLVPPFVEHAIMGMRDDEMLMLAYSDRPYDAN